MRRRTDPFKVVILIMLLILFGLVIFNLTGTANMQNLQHRYGMQLDDVHTHLEAINPDAKPINMVATNDCGEYQIVLELDGILVYDGDRLVSFIPNSELNVRSAVDSIFMKDNQ